MLSSRIKGSWVILALSLVYWVIYLKGIPMESEFLDLSGDSAQYIILAESLSQGKGLRMINYPGEPVVYHFGPLFPYLLSPILFFLGRNFWLMHLLVAIFSLLALIIFYQLLRNSDTQKQVAFLAILFLGLSRLYLFYSQKLLTDIPFLFLLGLSWLFLAKYNQRKTFLNRDGFLTILGLILAYLCRPIGIVFILLSLVYLFIERPQGLERKVQFKKGLFFTAVLLSLALFWYRRYIPPGFFYHYLLGIKKHFLFLDTYRPFLGPTNPMNLFLRFLEGINFYFEVIAESIFAYLIPDLKGLFFYYPFLILIGLSLLIGLWSKIKERRSGFIFCSLVYLILLSLWPYREDGRYLLPIMPFLLFYFFSGLNRISQTIFKRFGIYFFWGLVLLLFCLNLSTLPLKMSALKDRPQPEKDFISLHRWIKENLAPGIIVSRKPSVTYLYTGHQAISYPFGPRPEEVWEVIVRNQARYVILDTLSREGIDYLRPFIIQYQLRLRPIQGVGDTLLFEIRELGRERRHSGM